MEPPLEMENVRLKDRVSKLTSVCSQLKEKQRKMDELVKNLTNENRSMKTKVSPNSKENRSPRETNNKISQKSLVSTIQQLEGSFKYQKRKNLALQRQMKTKMVEMNKNIEGLKAIIQKKNRILNKREVLHKKQKGSLSQQIQKKRNEIQSENQLFRKQKILEIEALKREIEKLKHFIKQTNQKQSKSFEESQTFYEKSKNTEHNFSELTSKFCLQKKEIEDKTKQLRKKEKICQTLTRNLQILEQTKNELERDYQRITKEKSIFDDQNQKFKEKIHNLTQRYIKVQDENRKFKVKITKNNELIKKREKDAFKKIRNYKTLKINYLDLYRKNQYLQNELKKRGINVSLANISMSSISSASSTNTFSLPPPKNNNEKGNEVLIIRKKNEEAIKQYEKKISDLNSKVLKLEQMNQRLHINNIVIQNNLSKAAASSTNLPQNISTDSY